MISEGQFVLFLTKFIYCNPSSKAFHPDGSDEAFLCRINKIISIITKTPFYLEQSCFVTLYMHLSLSQRPR